MRGIVTSSMPNTAQTKPPMVPALVLRSGGGDKPPVAMGGTAIERSMVSPGSIAVYDVKPAHVRRQASSSLSQIKTNQAVFAVYVQNAITGRSWIVHRRFSDFVAMRELMSEHFSVFRKEFPRLGSLIEDLYFPRKHKFLSKLGRVVEHRCDAFLDYLVRLHRLLISRDYLMRSEISTIGLSIFRGFLGSAIVQDPAHKAYPHHAPIRPWQLKPSERSPIHQCGSLHTVVEEELEMNDDDEVKRAIKAASEEDIPREDSTNSTDVDSMSEDNDDDFEEEEVRVSTMRESQLVDRRRAYKYARNRKVLLFLKKDQMYASEEQPVSSPSETADVAVVECEDNAKALAQLTTAAKE